jgi:hypothetical protein
MPGGSGVETGSFEAGDDPANCVRLVVNGQPCGAFIGVSPCASGVLFIGSERSLIVRSLSLNMGEGAVTVTGTVVDWGTKRKGPG